MVEAQKLSENPVDLAAMLGIDKVAAEKLTSKIQFTVKGISRLAAADACASQRI